MESTDINVVDGNITYEDPVILYFSTINDFKLEIFFNNSSKIVQKRMLEELKADYSKALENRNRIELAEIGRDAMHELLPKNVNLLNYRYLQNMTSFPIEMIWINDIPISAQIPIVYYVENTLKLQTNTKDPILLLSESIFEDNQVDLVIPDTLRTIKKEIYSNNYSFLVLDGHHYENALSINDLRLYQEELPDHKPVFLNGCNTDKLARENQVGYVCRTKVKDNTAKEFRDLIITSLLENHSFSHTLMHTIREMYEKDISTLGYIFRGTYNMSLVRYNIAETNSKFKTSFHMKSRPDLVNYYKSEKLIQYHGIQTTRVELFSDCYARDQIEYSFNSDYYELNELIKPFCDEIIQFRIEMHEKKYGTKPPWWEGTVIHVNDFIQEEDKIILNIQNLKFNDLSCTNLSPELFLESWGSTIRDKLEHGPKLNSFQNSLHPNQIGIGTIIVTDDNYMVLQERSAKTFLTHKSQLGVTLSAVGYLKNKPRYLNSKGIPDIFEGIKAQAYEELGIEKSWFDEIYLIGATRSLENMGSLSFRFVSKLKVTLAEIKENWRVNNPKDNWEYENYSGILLPETKNGKIEVLKKLVDKYQTDIPSSTLVGFYFYEKALEKNMF